MRKADKLPSYCAVVKKSSSLNFLDHSGPAWPVTGVLYHYLYCLLYNFWCKGIINMRIKEMSLKDLVRVYLSEDRFPWRVLAKSVMCLHVP